MNWARSSDSPSGNSSPDPSSPQPDTAYGEITELSNIRHSLRTPLNQIIGYCEMMIEEAEDAGHPEFIQDLQKIHTAGGQLLALINDGFAPWKLETGRIDLDSIRLEMRTPLNLVIGYSELCQDMALDIGLDHVTPDLQKVTGAAKNLLALFDSPSFPAEIQFSTAKLKAGASAQATLGRVESTKVKESSTLKPGRILVVDDNEMNRDMLARRLERQGHTVAEAENGRMALEKLKESQFDLILLDVLMPEMNGFETLEQIKGNPRTRYVPVVMLSAMDELDSTVRCIEIGAEDYIPKPFNPVLLNARINASMEKKRLIDHEKQTIAELRVEREKSERLLLNILPKGIAERLKKGETTIADSFERCSVMYADVIGLREVVGKRPPAEMIRLLNDVYTGFDWLADLKGLERIKTFGDAYMVASGVPQTRPDHLEALLDMAFEMHRVTQRFNARNQLNLQVRCGISTGACMAGIIGHKNFFYYLWGETVDVARQMELQGRPGQVQVSAEVHLRSKSDHFIFKEASPVNVKSVGWVPAFFVEKKAPAKEGDT